MPEARWYTIKEVAERLRVSHDTVSRMIDRGALPAIRVSARLVRVPAPALHRIERGGEVARRKVARRRVDEGVPLGTGDPALETAAR